MENFVKTLAPDTPYVIIAVLVVFVIGRSQHVHYSHFLTQHIVHQIRTILLLFTLVYINWRNLKPA